MSDRLGWSVAIVCGAVLWTLAIFVEGHREPWDGEDYWSVWLPAAYTLSTALGFLFPEKPWRWPLALMLMQMPVMIVLLGGAGPLMVIGLVLLMAQSLPGMLTAWLGAYFRRLFERREPA